MAELQPSKLVVRVRSPSPAPQIMACCARQAAHEEPAPHSSIPIGTHRVASFCGPAAAAAWRPRIGCRRARAPTKDLGRHGGPVRSGLCPERATAETISRPTPDVRQVGDADTHFRGGEQLRLKLWRILYSGAALATLLMAAGAKGGV